ncbi:cellulose binding domain-containing protein [Duganella radicis]|uniref:Exo-alpha-sialidase n=1 Tax=Duganella radicis TaxID=551988 RepID=A0A6L6PC80_9BURK|nr:cellulose binding domain-containing protein [Duganella radicis]MTV36259.1 exo-alpha-sialidase [Duganella radicis]
MKIKPMLALLVAALGLPSAAGAENYHWDTVAMGGGGYVSGLIASKTERGIIYARTDVGGAYRWDAQNTRWIPLTDWISEADNGLMGIESLAVDPRSAAKVYMLAGTSYNSGAKSVVLRSSDYGKTFAQTEVTSQFHIHGNGMGRGNGEKLQVDPGNSDVLYAGSRDNGLFRSVDAGASWNRLPGLEVATTPNGNGISFVLLDATSVDGGAAQRMFIGISRFDSVGPNLYFSYDGGESFVPVEGGPTGLMPQRAVLSPDGLLYITYANGAGPHSADGEPMDAGQVWEYDAVGGNWTNITPTIEYAHPYAGIAMDPTNPKRLVLTTTNTYWTQGKSYGDQIFTSTDAGRHWTNVVRRGFELDPMGIPWIDNGYMIQWAGSVEFDPFNPKTVWVTSGNGVFRTTDIDATTGKWGFMVRGMEESGAYDIQSLTDGTLVTVIGDFDGFVNTDPSQYGVEHKPHMGTTTGLAVAAQDNRYRARVGSALYTTSDSGANWAKAPVLNGTQGNVALSANGLVLLHSPANSATTYRSTNNGASWSAVGGLGVTNARVVADPVNPNKFYAYDTTGKLMASTDGGASFALKGTLPSSGSDVIRVAPGHEGDLWVCLNSRGLTRSTDGGATFNKIGTVNQCTAVGFGKAAPDSNYPTIYMFGTVGSVSGMMRSTDGGASWVRLNDDAHQYGGAAASHIVTGDMNIYGQVYMSTNGRGVAYGKPTGQGEVIATPVTAGPPVRTGPPNECRYDIATAWQGGYIANVSIKNNGAAPINGWSVNWSYTDNSVVQSLWNANLTGSSPHYSASDVGWNAFIAPGATASFGMVVAGSAIPTVSGDVCN